MKYWILAIISTYNLLALTAHAVQTPQYCVATQVQSKSISEVQKDLRGRSKADVKQYFGRAPDVVEDSDLWEYKQDFADEDSGKVFRTARISFWPEGTSEAGNVNFVRFY
jgi:hypothetical protein